MWPSQYEHVTHSRSRLHISLASSPAELTTASVCIDPRRTAVKTPKQQKSSWVLLPLLASRARYMLYIYRDSTAFPSHLGDSSGTQTPFLQHANYLPNYHWHFSRTFTTVRGELQANPKYRFFHNTFVATDRYRSETLGGDGSGLYLVRPIRGTGLG